MSDLYSKKAAILSILATPEGAAQGNSEIAKAVGCEASTVRKIRAELETEGLRSQLGVTTEELRLTQARLVEMEARLAACQCQDFPARRPAVIPGRPRRLRSDGRPLFERPAEDGGVELIVGTIDLFSNS